MVHNRLESLPQEIGKLAELEGLGLEYNQLTELPKGMEKLRKLRGLSLKNNPLPEDVCRAYERGFDGQLAISRED